MDRNSSMRLTAFGEMNNMPKQGMDAKQFKKEMAELKPGEGVIIGDTKYEYGADLHTEGTPLIDPGTGKTISIRVFQFKMNPEMKKNLPNNQSLFNAHSKQIATILWADGLRPFEESAPRVIIDMKKGFYQFFVPCEARLHQMFFDKPQNLNKILNKAR